MISLILVLAAIGLIAWLITNFIPMPPQIKTLIIVVCVIVSLLYVLQAFGLIGGGTISVPKLK